MNSRAAGSNGDNHLEFRFLAESMPGSQIEDCIQML
jgi:hypothetical protein